MEFKVTYIYEIPQDLALKIVPEGTDDWSPGQVSDVDETMLAPLAMAAPVQINVQRDSTLLEDQAVWKALERSSKLRLAQENLEVA